MLEMFIYLVVLSVGLLLGYITGFEDGKEDVRGLFKEYIQMYEKEMNKDDEE